VAFSRGLWIFKIKSRFNKFGLSFSTASFLPCVTTKGESQFFIFYLVEINLGHFFNNPNVATCHVQN
jgi:hypothetical protein